MAGEPVTEAGRRLLASAWSLGPGEPLMADTIRAIEAEAAAMGADVLEPWETVTSHRFRVRPDPLAAAHREGWDAALGVVRAEIAGLREQVPAREIGMDAELTAAADTLDQALAVLDQLAAEGAGT